MTLGNFKLNNKQISLWREFNKTSKPFNLLLYLKLIKMNLASFKLKIKFRIHNKSIKMTLVKFKLNRKHNLNSRLTKMILDNFKISRRFKLNSK